MDRVAPCQHLVPVGVRIEDGLSEDEAVQTALSNNSAFQATLAQLGMAVEMRCKQVCWPTRSF